MIVDGTAQTVNIAVDCFAATSGTLVGTSFTAYDFSATAEVLQVVVDGASSTITLDNAACNTGSDDAAKATACAAALSSVIGRGASVAANSDDHLVIISASKGTGSSVAISAAGSGRNALALFGPVGGVAGVITGPTACATAISGGLTGASVTAETNGMLKITSDTQGTSSTLAMTASGSGASALQLFTPSGVPGAGQGAHKALIAKLNQGLA